MKKLAPKAIKQYFKLLAEAEDEFLARVGAIEILMKEDTGIEDIEFFWNDGSIVGIGNASRTMKLIHKE